MLVWGVDKCYYLVAEPPHSIWPYLKDEKGFEDFKKNVALIFKLYTHQYFTKPPY